jgi:hypothetical protein
MRYLEYPQCYASNVTWHVFLSDPHEMGQAGIRAPQYASSKNLVLFILPGRAFLHDQDPMATSAEHFSK